jgi:hypothetical protein
MDSILRECPECEGKGVGYFSCCTGESVNEEYAMCPECFEHLGLEQCLNCDGAGVT